MAMGIVNGAQGPASQFVVTNKRVAEEVIKTNIQDVINASRNYGNPSHSYAGYIHKKTLQHFV